MNAATWREVLADTQDALGSEREARLLCEHAAGLDASEFSASLDEAVTQRMALHLQEMIRRRLAGEPVQYVMGRWAFRYLDLLVDRRVLIPRPETEQVAEVAVQFARTVSPRVAVDLGTGSGAIGLSLAHELPLDGTTVWLTDNSPSGHKRRFGVAATWRRTRCRNRPSPRRCRASAVRGCGSRCCRDTARLRGARQNLDRSAT
ncbi:MAG: hypothetical protein EB111_00905 [Actinobacteria bacterium]|nr:hypothetical protein [Actinomycetota bacterium]